MSFVKNEATVVWVTLGAGAITYVLTVGIALVAAYFMLHGDRDPSWFDTVAWVVILAFPIVLFALSVPPTIVGVIVWIICKRRLNRVRVSKSARY